MNSLLTVKEVAKILRINYRKVLDLIHLGELPAYRVGGSFRITEEQIQKYLDSSQVKNYWKK